MRGLSLHIAEISGRCPPQIAIADIALNLTPNLHHLHQIYTHKYARLCTKKNIYVFLEFETSKNR